MLEHDEEAAILADAYIDALLARPRRVARPGPGSDQSVSRAAVLMSGLPRFHPSFAFEEALAARLRQLADGSTAAGVRLADVIAFPPPAALPAGLPVLPAIPAIDRRLLVGGAAIASGVSVAVIAWWQVGRRQRQEVVA